MVYIEERLTFVGEDDIEIEMRVPQEAVRLIIGRQGANIKQVSVNRQVAFQASFPSSNHITQNTHAARIFKRKTTGTLNCTVFLPKFSTSQIVGD